jgi:peptidyl-prolyl cis-trans isomerase C
MPNLTEIYVPDQSPEMSSSIPALDYAQPESRLQGLAVRFSATLKRASREPLVHFLLIGLALFGLYVFVSRGQGANVDHQIVISLDDVRQLDISFVSQWQRQPTQEEFTGLIEAFIRQEVLYREGLAMGLDKDDTIVKRRMAQKMEFLSEDVASAHEPSVQELQDWYAKNSQKFALPDRATFRHLFFSFDRHGPHAESDAAAAFEKIAGKPEDSPAAVALADPFMFQDYYGDRGPDQLAKEFGPSFALGLFQLKPGSWQGPIESGYGWHLVWIESVVPGRIPAFEEVEPDVKTAWLAAQKADAWRKAYAEMRARYEVVVPQPPAETAESKTGAPTQVRGAPQANEPGLGP